MAIGNNTVPETDGIKDSNVSNVEDAKRDKIIAYINKISDFIKIPLMKIINYSSFFITAYLIGWTLNAIYPNLHFDLDSLRDFYFMIIGKDTVIHSVNSVFNSDKGQMPTTKGK